MVSAMGPEYQKYLWWKKHLTTVQLVGVLVCQKSSISSTLLVRACVCVCQMFYFQHYANHFSTENNEESIFMFHSFSTSISFSQKRQQIMQHGPSIANATDAHNRFYTKHEATQRLGTISLPWNNAHYPTGRKQIPFQRINIYTRSKPRNS